MPVPLLRAASLPSAGALPDPWPALAHRFNMHFYESQFCMLAGAPGAGKTMLALDMALKMRVPTFYVSADSDDLTMRVRVASILTGHDQGTVRQVAEVGLFKEVYGHVMADLPMRFLFDPSEPSMEDIANALEAYYEVHSAHPKLIVVDNIMNIDSDMNNEWAGIRTTAKDLHLLARKTKACVVGLHHTSEQDPRWVSGAPPRSAIQGKISHLQPLILTVASQDNELWIAVVKNRFGIQDPGATNPFRFTIDFSTGRIWDQPMMTGVGNG